LNPNLKRFLFPPITRRYLLRVLLVVVLALLFFNFVCIPFRIKGYSMEPTYMNGEFNFCFRFQYAFSKPERGDVVVIRLAGKKVMLLKRVVALEGDVVEFCEGKLFVNEKKLDETYVHYRNHVYVVGDNRNVPIDMHRFGQTSIDRIIGAPLWKK
jgi:signal peptidase I